MPGDEAGNIQAEYILCTTTEVHKLSADKQDEALDILTTWQKNFKAGTLSKVVDKKIIGPEDMKPITFVSDGTGAGLNKTNKDPNK